MSTVLVEGLALGYMFGLPYGLLSAILRTQTQMFMYTTLCVCWTVMASLPGGKADLMRNGPGDDFIFRQ